MIFGIASDHRGYKLKEKVKRYLKRRKIDFVDYGTESKEVVDYNDYARKVCEAIQKGEVTNGILICGTGIGMSIMANKFKGIMCAKVDSAVEGRLAKEHNDANVISFSADLLFFEAKDIIDSYVKSEFLNTEKYINRIEKIKEVEEHNIITNKKGSKKTKEDN